MENNDANILIDSFKKEDRRVLLDIYKTYFPQVRHYILSNSGNSFDAEDIFQDALILIYIKIRKNTFYLTSSFGTYINSVVRFLWLKKLEEKSKYFGSSMRFVEDIPDEADFIEDYIRLEKRKLILEHFAELNDECRKILDLYIKATAISRITALMGYSSDQYTKNRRTNCKDKLIKAIWNNPRYKELKNEAYRQDTKIPRW